jgi:hypothetical protein
MPSSSVVGLRTATNRKRVTRSPGLGPGPQLERLLQLLKQPLVPAIVAEPRLATALMSQETPTEGQGGPHAKYSNKSAN